MTEPDAARSDGLDARAAWVEAKEPLSGAPDVFAPDAGDAADEAEPESAAPLGNHTLKRKSAGGVMLGAAMLGLRDILYGKPKEDSVIEIESAGDPPNIDLDGLDEALDDDHRLVAPPMDAIKAKGRRQRRSKARRSA